MLAILGLVQDRLGLDELVEREDLDGHLSDLDRGGTVHNLFVCAQPRDCRQQVQAASPRSEVDDAVTSKQLGRDRDRKLPGREDLRLEPLKGSREALAVLWGLPEANIGVERHEADSMDRGGEATNEDVLDVLVSESEEDLFRLQAALPPP